MERFLRQVIVLGVVGLLAQLVDGALGMAYGVTSTTLLLVAGIAPATASASVHLSEVGTTLVSGISHHKFGNVDWPTVRRIAAPGAIGAFLGAVALSNLDGEVAKPYMAGVLLLLGVYLLIRFAFRMQVVRETKTLKTAFLAPLGLFGGFVDATGGGGWGPVTTPTLLASNKMEPRKVVGSVDTSEFVVSVAASIGFLLSLGTQGIQAAIVLPLLIGGMIAAPAAAYIVKRVPAQVLGTLVGGIIILSNARTVLQSLGLEGPQRAPWYGVIFVIWAAAIALTISHVRKERDDQASSTGSRQQQAEPVPS
jgi:uncharacterized membrane protein YfcA